MSDNILTPEDAVLKEWLRISERKFLFVVWYVEDLNQLVEVRKVLERLHMLQVEFQTDFRPINENYKLAAKMGVKEEVSVLMFKNHELLEFIGPETGTTKLLRALGKYV
ncbi:hypothetical protein [Neolewinella persica]|uniref:hypothetical protein n=1 Tax=Neolewinella persica TaxID=70998 RepID=UPI0003A8A791|nr:hypothetical protein [Neolewinella persica]